MTNVQKGLPKVVAQTSADHDAHLATLTTTSSKIRYLASVGFSSGHCEQIGSADSTCQERSDPTPEKVTRNEGPKGPSTLS